MDLTRVVGLSSASATHGAVVGRVRLAHLTPAHDRHRRGQTQTTAPPCASASHSSCVPPSCQTPVRGLRPRTLSVTCLRCLRAASCEE
jgi:hypothetical protein